jgi:PAS domain S-box-containing protein
MDDSTTETAGRATPAARPDRPAGGARVAALEAENAALRRALARAGLLAERVSGLHGDELAGERAGRAADAAVARSVAAEAEARHGREAAAGRADLAASEADNEALRRANAALAESRAALREREERLRLILASATDYAILSMDTDRRITSWNEGAERLLGWREDEVVGRPADLIFTPEDRAGGAPGEEAEGAVRDGRAADERWHQRKDGTRFWANGLMLPLRDPDADPAGPPNGLLKLMRDETGKRRAEMDMALERAHLSAMLDLLPAGVGITDRAGRVVRCNPALRRFVAGAVPSAAGAEERERWIGHHPDGSRIAPRDFVVARALRGETVVPGVEFRYLAEDGPPRWTRVAAVPVPDPGGGGPPSGAVVLVEDIHESKAAEEALREGEARWRGVFEHMHQGFVLGEIVYGPDGRATDYRLLEATPPGSG